MPQNITDVDTWTTPLQDLSDGDLLDGAAFLAAQQGVGNRTHFLRQRVYGALPGSLVPQPLAIGHNASSRFAYTDSLATAQGIVQTSVADAGRVMIHCPAGPSPEVGTSLVQGIVAAVVALGSHAGGLPATMPKLELYGQSGIVAPTLLGTVTDASASVGAYTALHLLSITGLAEPYDNHGAYYAALYGETGANSETGFLLLNLMLQVEPA